MKNDLKDFLIIEKERLDLIDVIFDGEDGVEIFFYKKAMPMILRTIKGIEIDQEFDGDLINEKGILNLIKMSIVKYLYNILELLNSNDSEILSDYHEDVQRLAHYEFFIIVTLNCGNLDRMAKGIFNDLKDGYKSVFWTADMLKRKGNNIEKTDEFEKSLKEELENACNKTS